jgi:hypothetical protein
MTLESTLTKQIYEGNGAATVWPVPYQYSRAETIFLTLVDADGHETPVTSNFQVVVSNGATSVKYPVSGAPLPAGVKLVVRRVTPKTQIVDLVYGGAFNPNILEHDGFDRLEMQIQEMQEELDRCLKFGIISGADHDTAEEYLRKILEGVAAAKAAAAQAAESEANARGSDEHASEMAQRSEDFAGNAYTYMVNAENAAHSATVDADRSESCMIQSCACAGEADENADRAQAAADSAAAVVAAVTEELRGIKGLFNNLFDVAMECCGSVEDYRYVFEGITEDGDYGLITDPVTKTEDWGGLTGLFNS